MSIHNLQDTKWTLYQLSYCADLQPSRHKWTLYQPSYCVTPQPPNYTNWATGLIHNLQDTVDTRTTEVLYQSTTSKTKRGHYTNWATVLNHNLQDTLWTLYQLSYCINPQPPWHKVDTIPTELLCPTTTSKTQRGHYTNSATVLIYNLRDTNGHYTNWASVSIHNLPDTKWTLY